MFRDPFSRTTYCNAASLIEQRRHNCFLSLTAHKVETDDTDWLSECRWHEPVARLPSAGAWLYSDNRYRSRRPSRRRREFKCERGCSTVSPSLWGAVWGWHPSPKVCEFFDENDVFCALWSMDFKLNHVPASDRRRLKAWRLYYNYNADHFGLVGVRTHPSHPPAPGYRWPCQWIATVSSRLSDPAEFWMCK